MFELAQRLGKSVTELGDMPYAEYAEWMALDVIRNQEREKEERMAKMAAKRRGR